MRIELPIRQSPPISGGAIRDSINAAIDILNLRASEWRMHMDVDDVTHQEKIVIVPESNLYR